LILWREKWIEIMGRQPTGNDLIFVGKMKTGTDCTWLGRELKAMAMRMSRNGLIKNGEPLSWHSHALRHSFSTECSHAGVKPEVREYFMGHVSGVSWVYQHNELHLDDIVSEYQKVEPYLSLDFSEVRARRETEQADQKLLQIILELQKKVSRLEEQSGPSGAPAPAGSRAAPTSGP
jgi:hypothetical protein